MEGMEGNPFTEGAEELKKDVPRVQQAFREEFQRKVTHL